MALVIREMCPGDRQEVQALLRAAEGDDSTEQEGSPPAEKILQERSPLGLVACEEGKIIAAMVCDRDGQCGFLHHLPEKDQSQSRDDIAKALIDKTMLKLNARGVGKFRIDLPQGAMGRPLWDEVKWGNASTPDSSGETATAATEQATQAVEQATAAIEDIAQVTVEPALETAPITDPQPDS